MGMYSHHTTFQLAIYVSDSLCVLSFFVCFRCSFRFSAPNFNDFVPFAGWSHPAIKQYAGDVGLCSFDVDANWYPDGSRENWQKMWPEAFNATRH